MTKKRLISLGLATCLVFGGFTISYASDGKVIKEELKPTLISQQVQEDVKIIVKEIKSEAKELIVNAQIPQIQGLKDVKFQSQLNNLIMSQAIKDKEKIEKEAKEFAQEAKKQGWEVRPFQLTIDYSLKSNLNP